MGYKNSDIKVYGRFWSETTDSKIIDASQIDGFNLENGTGTGSLVQKRLKSDGVTWTTAKAYQGAGIALGGGTQSGRTEAEFNAYFYDSANNVPLHGGQGKTEDGKIKDNRGLTYEKSYSYSVAEGETTKALGRGSHSEGSGTRAIGEYSHAEGYHSYSTGDTAHSEGWSTHSLGRGSHSEGEESRAEAVGSHAEGYNSKALAPYSHTEGTNTESSGDSAHSEGQNTKAIGNNSHAEGDTTIANGESSHAEGRETTSKGLYSHAEGYKSKEQTTAYTPPTSGGGGSGSGVPGEVEDDPTTHIGQGAHAEGILTISAGYATHTEGARTAASGDYTHAEGYGTYAGGSCTHAEGYNTTAISNSSHAEGCQTITKHAYSHVEGLYTKSSREAQHVEGKYNADNPKALHIVGNGTSDSDTGRKNAFEVLEDGRAKVQSAPQDTDDVANKGYVDTADSALDTSINNEKIAREDAINALIGSGIQGTGNPPLQGYNKDKGTIEERFAKVEYKTKDLGSISDATRYLNYPHSFVYYANYSGGYSKYDCFYSNGSFYFISNGSVQKVSESFSINNFVRVVYVDLAGV